MNAWWGTPYEPATQQTADPHKHPDVKDNGTIIGEHRTGFRVWRITHKPDGIYLASTHQPDVWHPQPWQPRQRHEAKCHAAHQPPHDSHPCGIHAYHDQRDAETWMRRLHGRQRSTWQIHDHYVVGAVNYWGATVHHTKGARAQYAYPRYLTTHTGIDPVDLQLLAVKYGISRVNPPTQVPSAP